MSTVVVTGTGTEIGKTVVTAAVAALAVADGRRVAVVKPVQTGDARDVDDVTRLAGIDDVHQLAGYPEPLAPATAARRAGIAPDSVIDLAGRVREFADRDLVLVEGAGGLLVHLDGDGRTIADLASALEAAVLVVAPAGLGTLNAVALTAEALRRRELECLGVVVGAWPTAPDLAMRCNLEDIPAYAGAPLLGCLPEGAGRADSATFLEIARRSLAPALGGQWRPDDAVTPP